MKYIFALQVFSHPFLFCWLFSKHFTQSLQWREICGYCIKKIFMLGTLTNTLLKLYSACYFGVNVSKKFSFLYFLKNCVFLVNWKKDHVSYRLRYSEKTGKKVGTSRKNCWKLRMGKLRISGGEGNSFTLVL